MPTWLIWLTPVLATLAVLIESAYEAGAIHSATGSLILSILTAIAAYVVAVKERNAQSEQQALQSPQPQQQQPKPTPK